MPAMTVARLLTQIERVGPSGQGLGQGGGLSSGVPRGAVLIVDEASMCSTHDLDRITAAAQAARTKVVLVGDPAQIGVVEGPGGLLGALADRCGAVS
jgi:hypothetical protein